LLVNDLDRLKGLLMPLFDSDLHLVTTQALKHVNESLQGGVALLVEAAVGKELINGVLLAR
jgi:hypothetical protein